MEEGEAGNRRNGKGKKRVRTESGMIDLEPPRDRDGSFNPQIVEKRQRKLNTGLDEEITSLVYEAVFKLLPLRRKKARRPLQK